MNQIATPLVEVEPVAFERGSTLHMVKVNGKDTCCFVGETAAEARCEANAEARAIHARLVSQAYDALDEQRRLAGRPKISRPNVL